MFPPSPGERSSCGGLGENGHGRSAAHTAEELRKSWCVIWSSVQGILLISNVGSNSKGKSSPAASLTVQKERGNRKDCLVV